MSKKILYVITKASWGGATRYVYDLAVAAQKEGYDVAVAYGSTGVLASRLQKANVRTIEIKSLERDIRIWKDASVYRDLLRIFKEEKPAIVHLNSAKAGGIGALAARIARVPHIIFTAHGWAFNEIRPWWQRGIIRILSALTVSLAHTTICVSEAIKRDIDWLPFNKNKFVVIHNGIECAKLLPRADAREALLPTHKEKMWVGMLSELHPTKRIIDAIFAMSTLVKKHPETILIVLGEGDERARLEKAIRALDLSNHVFLIGFISDGPSYMSAFDIFLHASCSEALGYAILEAGCAGLPVVATNVGGIPEIIENDVNGILIHPEHSGEIVSALQKLIDSPDVGATLGNVLKAKVSREFSEKLTFSKTLKLYHG